MTQGRPLQAVANQVGDLRNLPCCPGPAWVGVQDNRDLSRLLISRQVIVNGRLELTVVQLVVRNVEVLGRCRVLQAGQVITALAEAVTHPADPLHHLQAALLLGLQLGWTGPGHCCLSRRSTGLALHS